MKRYLCRHVIADGVDMGLCVVTITSDGGVAKRRQHYIWTGYLK